MDFPSKPNAKGRPKTESVLRGQRIEGTYRKSEPDGYPVTHFYDAETRQNAIFKQISICVETHSRTSKRFIKK